MDQNVTVKIGARVDGNVGNQFKQMAADGKRLQDSFDGVTKSIKASQQAMAKFADSIKFPSEQAKLFSKWAGTPTGGNSASGFGGPLSAGGNPMAGFNATGLFDMFHKLIESGKAVVSLFDAMSGGGDGSRAGLRKSGQLGSMAADLADLTEDVFDRSGASGHEGSQLDQWRKNSQERKRNRQAGMFQEAEDFARPFQEARRGIEFGAAENRARLEWEQDARNRGDGGTIYGELHANRGMGIFYRDQLGKQLSAADSAGKAAAAASKAGDPKEGILRGQHLTELKFAESMQQKLVQLEEKRLGLIERQGKERQDQVKMQLQAASAEEERLKGIIDQEKARRTGFAAEFGMLDPFQQQQARQLAGKVGGGGKLSREELEAARGFGFFGDTVQQQASALGEQAGFGSIAKALGLDLKQQQAEIALQAVVKAQVDLKNELKISIEANAEALSQQFIDKVMPEYKKFAEVAAQRVVAEMTKGMYVRQTGQNQ